MSEDEHSDMTAPAGVRLAHEIRRRRTEAGLSQPQLARMIGYTRQYVSLAERVGHNLPSAEVIRALDQALNAMGALIALRERCRSEQKRLRGKSPVRRVPQNTVSLEANLSASATRVDTKSDVVESIADLTLDAPPRRRVGRAEVGQVKLMTSALAASENLYGGGMTSEAGIAHLRWASRMLKVHSEPAVEVALFEAVGNLAGVVAFSAFDVGDHPVAARCFRFALSCAEQGGSWELRAATLTDMARQAVYLGDLDQALSLIEFAQVRADRLTATARAVIGVVRARVLAMLGRHEEARSQVDRADSDFAQRQTATEPAWLVYYDEAEHAGSSARALIPIAIATGRPGEAAKRLETAVRLHSDAYPRSRAFSRTRLAALHMSIGDPREATALGRQAVADAAMFHSQRMNGELRALMRASGQHLAIPEVADLSHSLASAINDA
ncbi:helix-turn-helix transcriptional regulator [Actinosynnema sp. NPDC023587]|uniref:helix-turn-helix transcriptional regulator n=1 Tax=Actinosynnema sp. NPDC023587 TaxID=3154695 RepID=UPI00340E2158